MNKDNITSEILNADSFNGLWQTGTGDNFSTSNYIPWQPYYNYPIIDYWWRNEPNKTEQAFKITKVLLDQKLIKLNTIKQFIDLMDKLVKII